MGRRRHSSACRRRHNGSAGGHDCGRWTRRHLAGRGRVHHGGRSVSAGVLRHPDNAGKHGCMTASALSAVSLPAMAPAPARPPGVVYPHLLMYLRISGLVDLVLVACDADISTWAVDAALK